MQLLLPWRYLTVLHFEFKVACKFISLYPTMKCDTLTLLKPVVTSTDPLIRKFKLWHTFT